ncbi:MAG: efflux RND transporter permease subunit [Xanthomonadales bacterium]|nr:efflux RND transporter permease subunit [Xanthomonadales bacterium]
MWLSDTSVKRPVFATVISLLLIAFGVLSFQELPTREYPDIIPPVISVQTNYAGASASVVESRITQLLEKQIAGIEGIRNITSRSQDGRSSITIEFDLDVDLNEASNDVRDRVTRVARALPDGVDLPSISKRDSDARPIMYMSLTSDDMQAMALNDYAERFIVDRFNVIPGISRIDIFGSGRPSMRIWVDRIALAARQLTIGDVEAALRRQNIELPAGTLESSAREVQVKLARDYQTPEDFRKLVVTRGDDGYLVRLGELARVELAPQNIRNVFRANASNTIALGVVKQSTANTVEVLEEVKRTIAAVNADLPGSMSLVSSTDDSVYIRAAIKNVYVTIGITTMLVSGVILLFLGSFRAMLIPAVTIPICLVSSFIALSAFGFSINLITLLALVLCIGLVVDDAIVVVENIHRRIEKGEPPLLAAYKGTRQVAFAVIATTLVLVAVFTPIIFLKDNLGQLFGELAVTVSAAMVFSTVLALSLTPMMCSKLFRAKEKPGSLAAGVDRVFERINAFYERTLRASLRAPAVAVLAAVGVVAASWYLFNEVEQEYAPQEDQGTFLASFRAAEGSSFERMSSFVEAIEAPMLDEIESGVIQRALVRVPGFGGRGNNTAIVIVTLAQDRPLDVVTSEVMRRYSRAWNQIPGLRAFTFQRSGLSRGGGGQPVQVVLGGTDYGELAEWRDIVLARAAENPGLIRVESNLDDTQPQVSVSVNRNRAAALGVSLQAVGTTLESMMAEKTVATYVVNGEEYEIIMQAEASQRRELGDLQNIFVRSELSGELIPLASVVNVRETAGASQLNRVNRLRAVTISANLAPDYTLPEALAFIEGVVENELPPSVRLEYQGESLEYKEATGNLAFTFGIALLVVFLVLAAQFESFIHPIVIMIAVPLAIAGGLLGLYLTATSFNIFSQIGLIILIGIATKNGILIVEFINQVRETGEEFENSIVKAATIRLRPVLMTTISTTAGSVPLMLATGPGAISRVNLGIVMFFGVLLSAFMTLYIVPAFYKLLARNTRSRNAVAQKLETLAGQVTGGQSARVR